MIDVGEKQDTRRKAVASGSFYARPETIARIRERSLPKGDVLVLAEVAGIQGAKRTSELLPLCHPLSLNSVRVWTEIGDREVRVHCEANTIGKTGVEMEALCGVSSALLCLYDLTKGIDSDLKIGEIVLDLKEGGKSGVYLRSPEVRTSSMMQEPATSPSRRCLDGIKTAVITLSDRCHRGECEDRSGPLAIEWLESRGANLVGRAVLPDDVDRLEKELRRWIESGDAQLVVTSGGTGLSMRDITPEAIRQICREFNGKEIPGFGERLRATGATHTNRSWLSRSGACLIRETLVICLPGSPAAVREGLDAVGELIPHVLHVAKGGTHP